MMDWISIKDRLPPNEENVILYDGNEVFCGNRHITQKNENRYSNQCCDGICYGWYEKEEITHWMSLPSPPEEK